MRAAGKPEAAAAMDTAREIGQLRAQQLAAELGGK